jgi:hypothetical protein
MRSAKLGFLCVLLATVAISACGGDDDDDDTGSGGSAGSLNLGGSRSSGGTSATAGKTTSSAGEPSGSGGTLSGTSGTASGGASAGGTTFYLPCESAKDCEPFGGGKVCCALGSMHFCTKPSACSGETLP